MLTGSLKDVTQPLKEPAGIVSSGHPMCFHATGRADGNRQLRPGHPVFTTVKRMEHVLLNSTSIAEVDGLLSN